MALRDIVQGAFSAGGGLDRAQAHFAVRDGQVEMAMAVADAVESGGALVVEAGTGVGKTFAYLVPALLSGERVIVSTATKALQDQLFARDLPRLAQALDMPLRLAILKGRSSYLCLHRMESAWLNAAGLAPHAQHALSQVALWAQASRNGDLSELPGLDERSPVIPLVTSNRDNCLGATCPHFAACHVHLARKEALAADVVVINHHLFFADHVVRESGMAELLPSVRLVIFDEAHQIHSVGTQFLGTHLSTGQLLDFAHDMRAVGLQHARGFQDWRALEAGIVHAARDLRMAVGMGAGGRLAWTERAPEAVDFGDWSAALVDVDRGLRAALAAVDAVTEVGPDIVRLHERGVLLLERLACFAHGGAPDTVRWLEVGTQLRLVESPLDIAPQLTRLWRMDGADEDSAWAESPEEAKPEGHRTWIFTSATLGDDAGTNWFTEPCGLQGARVLRIPSPFDYVRQAALYVPLHLPKPSDPAHGVQLAHWAAGAIARLGGKTLVLTTTLRALQTMGRVLREHFSAGSGIEVLVQGEMAKRQLAERFRGVSAASAGRVLVASASFWEGFDVPGDDLQLVIIDKLPFPPPGDPVVDARVQRLKWAERSAFKDFALPEAAVALKQGAGRLIRSETDAGLLVVGDTRLVSMGYGKRLLRALPPMQRLQSEQEFTEALQALLTRASTTDHLLP